MEKNMENYVEAAIIWWFYKEIVKQPCARVSKDWGSLFRSPQSMDYFMLGAGSIMGSRIFRNYRTILKGSSCLL